MFHHVLLHGPAARQGLLAQGLQEKAVRKVHESPVFKRRLHVLFVRHNLHGKGWQNEEQCRPQAFNHAQESELTACLNNRLMDQRSHVLFKELAHTPVMHRVPYSCKH